MTIVFEAPVFQHLSQIELGDDLVGSNESIHIGFETHVSIDRFLVEFDLDEAIRISTYDEINFGPVDHNYLFDIVDYVGQLLSIDLFGATIICTGLEVTVQNFVLVEPLGL